MLSTEMNWEVVQDFLNVSGIKGVALIDGQSRPYFKGIEKVLNSQQREALAQGVWQVLETIPENFDSFEFQFAGTQVYIHKMTRGLILLVLTHDSLLYPDYCEAFTKLKAAFEADDSATLESFRRLLGSRNTSQITAIKEGEPSAEDVAGSGAPADALIEQEIARNVAEQNGNGGAAFRAAPSTDGPAESAAASMAESRPVPPVTAENPFALDDSHRSDSAAPTSVSEPRLEDTLQDLFDQPESQQSASESVQSKLAQSKMPSSLDEKSTQSGVTEAWGGTDANSLQSQVPAESAESKPVHQAPLPADSETPPLQSAPSKPTPSKLTSSPAAEPLPSLSAPPDPMREDDFVRAQSKLRLTESDVSVPAPQSVEPKRFDVEGSVALPSASEASGSSKISDSEFGPDVRLKDWVEALNCLGHCATHYLGRAVVANYWRTSRPGSAWISTFDIERSGRIQPSPALPLEQSATIQQRAEMRDWAYRFSERCGRVIRDFPQLAETQGLSAEQRQLLEL